MDLEIRGESDSGEGSEGADDVSHDAMNNHVVMRTLFEMLPAADVCKWRKVSQRWDDAARSVLNHAAQGGRGVPVNLNSGYQVRAFLKMVTGQTGEYKLRFHSFILDLFKLSKKPIRNFLEEMGNETHDLSLVYNFPDDIFYSVLRNKMLPAIAKILPEVKHLVKLTLSYNIFLGAEEKRQPFQLPSAFPFLKALRIEEILDLGLRDTVASAIVERAPHLETIDLCQLSDFEDLEANIGRVRDEVPDLLEVAAKKNPTPSIRLWPLREECVIYSEETLDELTRDGPLVSEVDNVQRLELTYNDVSGTGFIPRVNKFLSFQAKSLLKLDVRALGRAVGTPLGLVRMEKLLVMEIYHSWYKNAVSPIRPFVPRQFPILHAMRLVGYRAEWRWFPQDLIIPTLEALIMKSYIGNADGETWHISFPNLELLVVYDSISFVKFTLSKFTKIETLDLRRRNREHAQAGNVSKDLWTIYTGGEPNQGAEVNGIIDVGRAPPRASLGNMKKLISLHLEISTTLELEAVVRMSRTGQLPKLGLTIEDYRPLRHTRSVTRKTTEMVEILRNYHIKVTYNC